ncbi:MAG TPA: putative baseplate assembly protein [Vicinamibacterales bacterium]|nr:putative baseplate assembly protein [Vicinamibacterales bacterium]
MPLSPPALDDRSFDDLLQDLLASIPAHTPEWSAPQQGDPGRTLLELFAWLGDALLYRANLIPEKQRIAFLKLLGMPLQPANPARGLVSLTGDASNTSVIALAPSATVTGKMPFETLAGIDLLPIVGEVFRKAPLSKDDLQQALPLLTGLQSLYKLGSRPTGYNARQVFGNDRADSEGIDLAVDTLDQSLWIALLAPKSQTQAITNQAVVEAIGGKDASQRILNVGFVPALELADPFADVGPRAAVTHSWQITLKPDATSTPRFEDLTVFDDTTAGLTRPGVIRLGLPPYDVIGAPPNDVASDAQAGVGAKPPRIDDVETQQRLITWVRLKATSALSVSWLGVNALEIDQRTSRQAIVLGVSDGTANQTFTLPYSQIDSSTFQLDVDMPGAGAQLWQQVDDLDTLPGPVPAFRLDPEAGVVSFGDNLRGMIPPRGRRVRVRSMRSGGGSAGNLPPGTLKAISARDQSNQPVTQKITVVQPIATTGGSDAEALDAAEQRIPSWLRHRDRAVTTDDYRSLAESIPGAGIGRVEVLPLFKPQTRTTDVPGVVSVMVIPLKDAAQPPCPRADRPLLETAFGYLNPRKPVAAELYVIGTEYVGLGVSVAVEVAAGYDMRVVGQQVEDALRRYLWPLEPGGPAQTGWPLGRHVRSLELEVIIGQVDGVVEVNGVQLFAHQADDTYQAVSGSTTAQQEVTIKSYQLPELLKVKVTTGGDGSGVTPPTSLAPESDGGDAGVAVPVVPKVC